MNVEAIVNSHELHGTVSERNTNLVESSTRNIKRQRCLKFVLPGISLVILAAFFAGLIMHKSRVGAPVVKVAGKTQTTMDGNDTCPKLNNQSEIGVKSVPEPCDDFYEFACQNWQLINPNSSNVFDKLEKEEMEIVSVILAEPIDQRDMYFLNEAKVYYQQCLSIDIKEACGPLTRKLFWWAIAHKIVLRKYKTMENFAVIKEPVLEMFQNVKSSLEELGLPLYSNTTPCIGMPEWIFDRDSVQSTYKGYSDSADWKRMKIWEIYFQTSHGLKTLTRIKDSECQWNDYYSNAYYVQTSAVSQTLFPDIILQSPYFGRERSSAQNYGGLAATLGHELVHAYTLNYWYRPKDEPMDKFIKCLERQYSSFTVEVSNNERINLVGRNTAQENFADNWGLRGAYHAYLKVKQSNKGAILPSSVEPTDLKSEEAEEEQEFFLTFAQTWCESKQNEQRMDAEDVHSPARFRVIGTLQNFPKFSKAYNCPLGSKMNPCQDNKCLLF